MITRRGALAIAVVVVGLAGVVWMFLGPVARGPVNKNASVLGTLLTLGSFLIAVAQWRRSPRPDADPLQARQTAVTYLAEETLRYWRIQAKNRRITTPSPASVRWKWAGAAVAVPATELHDERPGDVSSSRVLTAGVVTELREHLYERLDDTCRRVVMLGGPGAGKTAAMLLLLIDILKHRPTDSEEPVPVWLSLGGWDPQTTSLLDWAAETIARDYPSLSAPAYCGRSTAAELIRAGRIALFLDGLDEMPLDVQGAALTSIDRDSAGLRIVLTSRPAEYRAALAEGQLFGAAVIDILSVTADEATTFLLAEQLDQDRAAWRKVTDHLRRYPESVVARTLTTPLTLSLARDAYTRTDRAPAELLDTDTHPDPDALMRHLLARSLNLAYPGEAERAHATRWLSWIAQHMAGSRDLRWWDVPAWTPRWQLRLTLGLAGALAGSLVGGLLTSWVGAGPENALVGGLGCGLTYGGIGASTLAPRTLTARWPTRRELRDSLGHGLAAGLLSGLVLGLMVGFLSGFALGLLVALTVGLACGIFVWAMGLAFVVFGLWDPSTTAHVVGPVDVYRSDRRHSLVFGLMVGLVGGLAFGLADGLVVGLADGLVPGLAGGLVLGLAFGTFGLTVGIGLGFGPAVQLTVLQMIWQLRGQRVQLLPLLKTAHDRQILRQAGTVYQFRHAALQDFLLDATQPNVSRHHQHDDPSDLAPN